MKTKLLNFSQTGQMFLLDAVSFRIYLGLCES